MQIRHKTEHLIRMKKRNLKKKNILNKLTNTTKPKNRLQKINSPTHPVWLPTLRLSL